MDHPLPATLVEFHHGRLDATDEQQVRLHLKNCTECEQLLKRLSVTHRSTELFNATRTQLGSNESLSEPFSLYDETLTSAVDSGTPESANHRASQPFEVDPALLNHPRYEVIRPLGRGGMGVVWLAKHRTMERLVAIKVMRRTQNTNRVLLNWFRQEAKLISRLTHPHIVTAYDAEDAGETCYIVFEYVPGETLSRLCGKGPLELLDALMITRDVAEGLEYAHGRGLVHRDIKPSNLIRDVSGEIKILDFGVATELLSTSSTHNTAIVGTKEYLAPECLRGQNSTPSSDIYALGCTLYQLLGGALPLMHESSKTSTDVSHHLESERLAGLPTAVEELIGKMTHPDPDSRLKDASSVLRELDALLVQLQGNQALVPTETSTVRRTWMKKITLTAVGTGAAVAFGLWRYRTRDTQSQSTLPLKAIQEDPKLVPPKTRGEFQDELNGLEPGEAVRLLTPSTLGDGNKGDYQIEGEQVSLKVFDSDHQIWLNYSDVLLGQFALLARFTVHRFKGKNARIKISLLDDFGPEYNFYWQYNDSGAVVTVEKAQARRLERLWSKPFEAVPGVTAFVAFELKKDRMRVRFLGEEVIEIPCPLSPRRFPAISAYACDATVNALVRRYV